MTKLITFITALGVTVLALATAPVLAASQNDIQAPRGRTASIQASQDDQQAPRGHDARATLDDAQAPRGQDGQAPRQDDTQAPRGQRA
jgi:hypothetical protein